MFTCIQKLLKWVSFHFYIVIVSLRYQISHNVYHTYVQLKEYAILCRLKNRYNFLGKLEKSLLKNFLCQFQLSLLFHKLTSAIFLFRAVPAIKFSLSVFPRFRPFLNDSREDCRNLTEISENFCAKPENIERFRYHRSISGICNNLSPGKGAVGAADTQVARLAHKY